MYKKLIVVVGLIISLYGQGQKTVRIDFTSGTSADYDIYLKKAFENSGYTSFINYHDRRQQDPYDQIISYEEMNKSLFVNIHSKNGALISKGSIKLSAKKSKSTYDLVGELLNMKIDVDDPKVKIRGLSGMDYSIEKIDSAIYILSVRSKGEEYDDDVQQAFLNIAKSLAGKFKTYFENSFYQHKTLENASEGGYAYLEYQYLARQIEGIIVGSDIKEEVARVKEFPAVYETYLEKKTGHLTLPEPEFDRDSSAALYILRNTGVNLSSEEFIVLVDGQQLCELDNKHYTILALQEGSHSLIIFPKGFPADHQRRTLYFDIKNGQNIFINCLFSDRYGPDVYCQPVNKYEAKQLIQDLKRDESCLSKPDEN